MIDGEAMFDLEPDEVLCPDGTAAEPPTATPLRLREYRGACSHSTRQHMLERDAEIPARVIMEIQSRVQRRASVREARRELASLYRQTKPTAERCAETQLLERITSADQELLSLDAEISWWCDRLHITLSEGDYRIDNQDAYDWMKLFFELCILDKDLPFRNVEAWKSIAECLVEVGRRKSEAFSPPKLSQQLPWRPLAEFFRDIFHLPSRYHHLGDLECIQQVVRPFAISLCRCLSEMFSVDAFRGLWEHYSPRFRPEGSASVQALAYFVSMAPPFELYRTSEQKQLTQFILDFLFVKTQSWHSASASWSYFSWCFVAKLNPSLLVARGAAPNEGLLDGIAEPLFSSILYSLRLPIGETDMRRSLRNGGIPATDMLIGNAAGSGVIQRTNASLVQFLTVNVTSPLWNHLRRLLRATEVFVRPSATMSQGAQQLAALLQSFVGEMLRRVDRERRLREKCCTASFFMTQDALDTFATLLLPMHVSALYNKSKSASSGAQLAIQALCRLSPRVCLPEVLRYCSLGLDARSEPHQSLIALELLGNAVPELLLAHVSPPVPQPMASHRACQEEVAARPAEGSTANFQAVDIPGDHPSLPLPVRLVNFLHATSDKIIPLIDPNNMVLTMLATRIVFQSALYFDFYGLCFAPPASWLTSGGAGQSSGAAEPSLCEVEVDDVTSLLHAEQSFLLQFTDKLITLAVNSEGQSRKLTAAFFCSVTAVFCAASDGTMTAVVERVARQATELGHQNSHYPISVLLQAVSRRSADICWRRIFPSAYMALTDPVASVSEIKWFANILVGLIQCGDSRVVFQYRGELVRILRSLTTRITNRDRVGYAGIIYETLALALLKRKPKCGTPRADAPHRAFHRSATVHLKTAAEANVVFVEPHPEHIQFTVELFNEFVAARLAELDNAAAAVALRIQARNEFLHDAKRLSPQFVDDDEPITPTSLIRHTLGWLRRVMEINLLLLEGDEQSQATALRRAAFARSCPAPHVLCPRIVCRPEKSSPRVLLRDQGRELQMHADDIVLRILALMRTVTGGDNYVAMDSPEAESGSREENADVKSLKHALKLLSHLCNVKVSFDLFNEPTRLLFENWRLQFFAANGTRRMPDFYWLLSAELQEDKALLDDAFLVNLSPETTLRVQDTVLQLACHHRYREVQASARSLFGDLVAIAGPTLDIQKMVSNALSELGQVAAASSKLLKGSANGSSPAMPSAVSPTTTGVADETSTNASGAAIEVVTLPPPLITAVTPVTQTPNVRRFDHEISGLMIIFGLGTVLEYIVLPSREVWLRLCQVLTDFPDVLLPQEEAARVSLLLALQGKRLRMRLGEVDIRRTVEEAISRAHKLSMTVPSRAAKWLELSVSVWSPAQRRSVSTEDRLERIFSDASTVHQIVSLASHEHLRLRAAALQLLSFVVDDLKNRTPKVERRIVPELAGHEHPEDEYDVAEQQRKRRERFVSAAWVSDPGSRGLRNVGQCFLPESFVVDADPEPCIGSVEQRASAEALLFPAVKPSDLIASKETLQRSWIWQVIKHYDTEERNYSSHKMHFWKLLSRVVGEEVVVPVLAAVFRMVIEEWRTSTKVDSVGAAKELAKSKESQKCLIAVLVELSGACIRATKRLPAHAPARELSLDVFHELIKLIVSPTVYHEVLTPSLRCIMNLRDVVTSSEAQGVALDFMNTIAHRVVDRSSSAIISPTTSAASSSSVVGSGGGSNGSQDMIRLLTLLLQLLNTFSYDIMGDVALIVLNHLVDMKEQLLRTPLSQVRNLAASVVRQVLQCSLVAQGVPTASGVDDESNNPLVRSMVRFAELLLDSGTVLPPVGASTGKHGTLSSGVAEDMSTTEQDSAAVNVERFPSETSERGDTDNAAVSTAPGDLCECKANVVLWAYPATAVLGALVKKLVKFFSCALDIRLPEADDLVTHACGTLVSVAFCRMSKATAVELLEGLVSVLMEEHPFGRSRQAKMTICRALRVLVFTNLHRIGKFATVQLLTQAALQCMSHADKRVRTEGRTLFAVVVRVASVEQVGAIIRDLLVSLKVQAPEAAGTRGTAPGRLAACVALCGAALADPDAVPSYIPRVLYRLASFARDRNPDISSEVRGTLKDWWSSHRDKWLYVHQRCFTEQQLHVLMELFTSPSYYV